VLVNIYAPQGHEEFYVFELGNFPIPRKGDSVEISICDERSLCGRVKGVSYRYEVSKSYTDSGSLRCAIGIDAEAVEVSIELES